MRCKSLLIALTAAALAGCTAIQLHKQGKHELTEVAHQTYRLYIFEPWQTNFGKFREDQMKRARLHCEKDNRGAQLIDAVSAPKAPGIEGIILFKCVTALPPPPDSGAPHTKEVDLSWLKKDGSKEKSK